MLDRLTKQGVTFNCLRQSIDTGTSTGKLTLAILGAVAEFENDLRLERQRDGIEKAKQRGAYKGRGSTIDRDAIATMRCAGQSPSVIARELGISRASVYRAAVKQRPDK